MSKKYETYAVKGFLPGETIINGVDRLVHFMPWLTSTEMAHILGCKPDSVRSVVSRSGDRIRAMQQKRIEELLRKEFESDKDG